MASVRAASTRKAATKRRRRATPGGRSQVTLESVLDHLPFCIQLHGMDAAFTVRYRNRADSERLRTLDPDRAAARDPRLRSLAERVALTKQPGHAEIRVVTRRGRPLDWDWMIMPVLGERDDVIGLVSVVENVTSPIGAHRRTESALAQAAALIVEIAQLAERHDHTNGLLSAAARRLALRIRADEVTFYEYRPEERVLAARRVAGPDEPAGARVPATLSCDPDTLTIPAQVALNGRIYRGTVDFADVESWEYLDVAGLAPIEGTKVILVPWRAATERMGLVLARRAAAEDFTQEDGAVLIAAGHAAGLIRQRKRAERELARRAEALASLERAKSHFLSLASHELRGPVGLLNGYTSMLFDGDIPSERRRDVQRIMLQAIERMNLLLVQLMDVTRLQDGRLDLERRTVDLRKLVEDAAGQVLPLADGAREADFELRTVRRPLPVTVDAPRIGMVVQNLLDNAFKYSEPGQRVECQVLADDETLRVTVRDEGIGMTEDEREKLFTRFGRAVNERNSHIRGTGLGLFISREVARMHGGDVCVLPVAGRGSCFELVLPTSVMA